MHVAICSFIPHRVAPQQSSAMLQTAGTNIMLSIDLNKEKTQFSACNLTYRPKTTTMMRGYTYHSLITRTIPQISKGGQKHRSNL